MADAAPLVARGYALRLRAVHLRPRTWPGDGAFVSRWATVEHVRKPPTWGYGASDCGVPFQKENAPLTCADATPARARFTLPAERRLRRKADFDAAYAGGRRFGDGFFGVTAHWNDKSWPRLGLAVAVRTAGGGVERNRLRRIIRESFRQHQHELPGVDLVISARGRAKDATGPQLHASLVALWKKVKEQCATSPRS